MAVPLGLLSIRFEDEIVRNIFRRQCENSLLMLFKGTNFLKQFQKVVFQLRSYLEIRIINKIIFFVSYFPFHQPLL